MKKVITETTRSLRKNQTEAEELLWKHIKGRQLGRKFRRQYPIQLNNIGRRSFIVANFYCRDVRLIIELDDGIHSERKDHDGSRDWLAEAHGYQILRFSNDDVLHNISHVIMKIACTINYEIV